MVTKKIPQKHFVYPRFFKDSKRFTDDRIQLQDKVTWYNRYWCFKESALKLFFHDPLSTLSSFFSLVMTNIQAPFGFHGIDVTYVLKGNHWQTERTFLKVFERMQHMAGWI